MLPCSQMRLIVLHLAIIFPRGEMGWNWDGFKPFRLSDTVYYWEICFIVGIWCICNWTDISWKVGVPTVAALSPDAALQSLTPSCMTTCAGNTCRGDPHYRNGFQFGVWGYSDFQCVSFAEETVLSPPPYFFFFFAHQTDYVQFCKVFNTSETHWLSLTGFSQGKPDSIIGLRQRLLM